MASVAPPRIPDSLLQIMERAKDMSVSPEGLVRDVHRAWREAGGLVGGKPRHSDRFFSEQLAAAGRTIRSLTPKLNGRTRIRSEDAKDLLRHMLSHWPQPRPNRPDEVDYVAIEGEEVGVLVHSITGRIDAFDAAPQEVNEGGDAPSLETSLPGEDAALQIAAQFEQCDAYFTVATDTALVAQDPETNLLGFVDLMDKLRLIQQRDQRPRPLIWIINRGKLRLEDKDSRVQYLNMQNLMTRLRAIKQFNEEKTQKCWIWLKRNSFFITLDITTNQEINFFLTNRPEFEAKDLLLASFMQWGKSKNFRALYGDNFERVDQRNFLVFFKHAGWQQNGIANKALNPFVYFGYASFENKGRLVARGLQLPSPGSSYDIAFKIAYQAAIEHLKIKVDWPEGAPKRNFEVNQLQYLGFRLLNIDEFLGLGS